MALRNRPIHAYDALDLDIVWSIVDEDVPALIRDLQGILEGTDGT